MPNEPHVGASSTPAAPAGGAGLLRFRGADAAQFLQGQLSADTLGLSADRYTLAGLHNPQGRVLALLRLAAPEPGQIVALLPADLAGATLATLRRYVLRARVELSDASDPATLAELERQIPGTAALFGDAARARDIAAGIPQVYPATSGAFVAQMLNLDCIGAISFSKGCYTGQEIIARAHYRGRIKRRMQRFVSEAPLALLPGQDIMLGDGRHAQVVDAVTRDDARTEFLAVAPQQAGDPAEPSGARRDAPLRSTALPLPYPLPA